MAVAAWRRAWTHVIHSSRFRPKSDALPNTTVTNALESVHAQLGKIIKTRGRVPTDDASKTAMQQFAILYEDRFLGST